jgi:hypothetical protein
MEAKRMLTRAQQLQDRKQRLHEKAVQLQDKARQCRELADTAVTDEGRSILFEIAQRYENEALITDRPSGSPSFSEAAA